MQLRVYSRFPILLLLATLAVSTAFSETRQLKKATKSQWHVLRANSIGGLSCARFSDREADKLLRRTTPFEYRERRIETVKVSAQRAIHSEWVVNFEGFPPEARDPFLKAVYIWSGLISSEVPIVVDASFENFSNGGAVVVTTDSGPWLIDGESAFRSAALTDHQLGYDAEPGVADIFVRVDSSTPDFYYGLDGNPPQDRLDFVSIIIHELAHGLGFGASFEVEQDGRGYYGYYTDPPEPDEPLPLIFDTFVRDARYVALTGDAPPLTDKQSFEEGSTELGAALTSNQLIFLGPISATLGGWVRPIPLYAPDTYSGVSSISHLDEIAFPPMDPQALLTPGISPGEAIHHPGSLSLAMLADTGWTALFDTHIPQYGAGSGLSSDIVVSNPSLDQVMVGDINFFDPDGNAQDPFDLLPGITSTIFTVEPLGSITLSTRSSGDLRTGSVTLLTTLPPSAVVRFDLAGTGVTGVGAGQPAYHAVVPARVSGELKTGVAIRNLGAEEIRVELFLRNEEGVTVPNGSTSLVIPADGRISQFIDELFPGADTADFSGTLQIRRLEGSFAAVGVELELGKRFTTLPVALVR